MKCSVSIVGGTLPTAELEHDNVINDIRPSASKCGCSGMGRTPLVSGADIAINRDVKKD